MEYEELSKVITYNPIKGKFYAVSNPKKPLRLRCNFIKSLKLPLTHIAYILMNKTEPTTGIYYINGNCSDLRWENLTTKRPRFNSDAICKRINTSCSD